MCHVCVSVHMCAFACVPQPVSVSASLVCLPVCGSVYMSAMHTHMCMYLCESVHLCLCMCVSMCWYMCLSVYMQGWSHVLVYTHVHVCSSAGWKHVQTSCFPRPPRATEYMVPVSTAALELMHQILFLLHFFLCLQTSNYSESVVVGWAEMQWGLALGHLFLRQDIGSSS